MPRKALFDLIFEGYAQDETLSIKELTKNLMKKPLDLDNACAEQIARFCIEPKENAELEFNKYREKSVYEINQILENVLGISYLIIPSELDEQIEKTAEKFKGKMLKVIEMLDQSNVSKDAIHVRKWREIFQDIRSDLEPMEKDILIMLGYLTNKDITKLSIKVFFFINCFLGTC